MLSLSGIFGLNQAGAGEVLNFLGREACFHGEFANGCSRYAASVLGELDQGEDVPIGVDHQVASYEPELPRN